MSSNEELSTNVLIDAKEQYLNQLSDLLHIPMYEGLRLIWTTNKLSNRDNKLPESILLRTFQEKLELILTWSDEMVTKEYSRICQQSRCDYFDKLITAAFIIHVRILSSVSLNKHAKAIELTIPKPKNFIHKCYIECARAFWTNPKLFEDRMRKNKEENRITETEIQDNLDRIYSIIKECISKTIQGLLPVKDILDEYLKNDPEPEPEEEKYYHSDHSDCSNYSDYSEEGSVGSVNSDHEWEREREEDREYEREHEEDREYEREREKDREYEREREREKDREYEREDRDGDREREKDHEYEREREKDREYEREDREYEREERDSDREREREEDHDREREREKERDEHGKGNEEEHECDPELTIKKIPVPKSDLKRLPIASMSDKVKNTILDSSLKHVLPNDNNISVLSSMSGFNDIPTFAEEPQFFSDDSE